MRTVTIQIGNSDDKLKQSQWSEFVREVQHAVECFCEKIHFSGGSENWATWQNFAIICVVDDDYSIAMLKGRITQIRQHFSQDSVAITVGDTEFI